MFKTISKWVADIRWFLLCMLRDNCVYSIKKALIYIFTLLVLYLAVFTDKEYYEVLTFIAVALGIRSYERLQQPPKKDEIL